LDARDSPTKGVAMPIAVSRAVLPQLIDDKNAMPICSGCCDIQPRCCDFPSRALLSDAPSLFSTDALREYDDEQVLSVTGQADGIHISNTSVPMNFGLHPVPKTPS
jgi:hypothetical protein